MKFLGTKHSQLTGFGHVLTNFSDFFFKKCKIFSEIFLYIFKKSQKSQNFQIYRKISEQKSEKKNQWNIDYQKKTKNQWFGANPLGFWIFLLQIYNQNQWDLSKITPKSTIFNFDRLILEEK